MLKTEVELEVHLKITPYGKEPEIMVYKLNYKHYKKTHNKSEDRCGILSYARLTKGICWGYPLRLRVD